jgi:4-amino-4-deoxy-L-arabinose transferase-like glycosyltransferase
MGTALVALLAVAVQAPFFARGLSLLDEGTVVATADALAGGEALYRDRFAVVGPLAYGLLAAAFTAFGATLATARAFQAAVFALTVLLVLGVLRRVASERWAVAGALALLALKPLAFPGWTIANYSSVALAALLLALWALLRWLERRRARDLVWVGLGGGLAFLAKQNLGGVGALAVGATLLVDWARNSRPLHPGPLAARSALVLASALAPVGGFALHQAAEGALADTWLRAVVSVWRLADGWQLPFPPLAPWDRAAAEFGLRMYAYFPAPLVDLALAGGLDLGRTPLVRGIEWAVKLCYALPLVGGLLLAMRLPRAGRDGAAPLACLLFAAGGFASISYRADWAHLMNVWPLLHVALVGGIAGCGPRLRAPLAAGAAVVGLGLAALSSWALAAPDQATLRTPRGALELPAPSARSVEAVLAFAAERPPDEGLAFLPAVPGLHFLSGRPLPLAADALIPGVLDEHDEGRLLAQLERVERVVWDERPLPWVHADAIEVAPRLTAALATRFRFARRLSPEFLVFERAIRGPQAEVHALFARTAPPDGARAEHWLFHRVWALSLGAGERRCAEIPWRVTAGDHVVATPMSHPASWGTAPPPPPLDFAIEVRDAERAVRAERRSRVDSRAPGETWRLELPLPPGDVATLRFCAGLPGRAGGARRVEAGFSEPRIERGPATPPGAARRP